MQPTNLCPIPRVRHMDCANLKFWTCRYVNMNYTRNPLTFSHTTGLHTLENYTDFVYVFVCMRGPSCA